MISTPFKGPGIQASDFFGTFAEQINQKNISPSRMVQKLTLDSTALSEKIISGLQDIKGLDIVRMDLRHISGSFSEYFVICTGTSDKHVQALAGNVVDKLRDLGERPLSREGERAGEWVLLDYVNVVVHIFQQKNRDFFRLEKLWGDANFDYFPNP